MKANKQMTHNYSKRKNVFMIAGVMLLLAIASAFILKNYFFGHQSVDPICPKVQFQGEYKIGDGDWIPITDGTHISATKGDVTLHGTMQLISPKSGEVLGDITQNAMITFYLNHLGAEIQEPGSDRPYKLSYEIPEYGADMCGQTWGVYRFNGSTENSITFVLKNNHLYGNENAIDQFLSSMQIYDLTSTANSLTHKDNVQQTAGYILLIAAFVLLGTALFCTLLHYKSKILWLMGAVSFFAGGYLIFSVPSVSLWSKNIVTNTTLLGLCMIFYMLFLSAIPVSLFTKKSVKRIGQCIIAALSLVCTASIVIPIFSSVLFYDVLFFWAIAQGLGCIGILVCLALEFFSTKTKKKWYCVAISLPMLAFLFDLAAIGFGLYITAAASVHIFMILFAAATILILRIIPGKINAARKAKQLEIEKFQLLAELQESRIAIMISQIQPHFIYNTLGTIEQLCLEQPETASKLVRDFSLYLRGNFSELDNTTPIPFLKEINHVKNYTNIEQIRFPDMTIRYNLQATGFVLPALSVQPLVENAIKHGLMGLEQGGTVTITSYETDTDYCVKVEDDGIGFETNTILQDQKHVGLRNIRERLLVMCNGTLKIDSTPGKGTCVLITIPKEEAL